jgi:hypothetical protein
MSPRKPYLGTIQVTHSHDAGMVEEDAVFGFATFK